MKNLKTDLVTIATFQSHLNNWEIKKSKNWELNHLSSSYTKQFLAPKSKTKPSKGMLKTSNDRPSAVLHPGLDRLSPYCHWHPPLCQPTYTRQISAPKSQTKTSERMLKKSRDPFHDASAPPVEEDFEFCLRKFVSTSSYGQHSKDPNHQKSKESTHGSSFHQSSISSASSHTHIQPVNTLSNLPSYSYSNMLSTLDLPPSYSEAMGLTSSDQEFPDYGKISANRWYRSIY